VIASGTEVGGYRIESILGRGGMGVVYEATQLSLGRTVALKVLAAELSDDSAFRERFRREARTQAIIEHAHIVPVYEAGEIDEGLYIAMRLVRGPNLKQVITGGDLEPERALRILLAVGDALDAAHEADLIHRDIKPQNILIGRNDHAFLADFGLTKGKSDTGYTRTGQLMGTLDYVAPEQIKGELATAASDIYALAAVAYECIVGRPPFSRPTELATLYAHVSDPPPLPSLERPGLPGAADEVIVAGLAKNPAERPATAVELLSRLDEAFRPPAPPAPSPATARTKPMRIPPPPPPTAEPLPSEGQGTEIVTPLGTPTRQDLRRDWSPSTATSPADAPAEPRTRRRRRRRPAAPEHPTADTISRALVTGPPPAAETPRVPGPSAAEVASAPTPAEPSREAEPRAVETGMTQSRRWVWLVAALGAVGVAVLAGALAGRAATPGPPAPAPERVALRAGDLRLAAPTGWRAVGTPETFGVRFADGAVTARGQGSAVTAGMTAGSGATLLPADLRSRLDDPVAEPAAVRLGPLQAYRYDGLALGKATVTAYVAPTAEGTATVLCSGVDRAGCAAAAASLRAPAAVPLGPRAAFAKPVNAAVERLQRDRARALRAVTKAKTPAAQGRAAGEVARAYQTAAGRIGAVRTTALEADANPRLAGALRRAREQWARLATAAKANRRATYAGLRAGVARADDGVRRALAALRDLGYRVG
jgi:serine/threonine protein kinase